MAKTLDNFVDGLGGGVLLVVGFFIMIGLNIWLGLAMMVVGLYFKYKSETYVHTK